MKFFAVALAAFAAGVSAHSYDQCTVVTVTETVTYGHTVPVPGASTPAVIPPYPTGGASSAPAPTGTGAPGYPVGTGYPPVSPPAGTGYPQGPAQPTGTGVYRPAPPEFTGAASAVKVGGVLAGAGAFAAFFL